MEIWTLEHPRLGEIVVEVGYDEEFKAIYPDWPTNDDSTETKKEILIVPVDSPLWVRTKNRFKNPPVRSQISVGGKIMHRISGAPKDRLSLVKAQKNLTEFSYPDSVSDRSQPHLKCERNLANELLEITYRDEDAVVEFDPPTGTQGDRHRTLMQSSDLRRVMFPITQGLAKGGWALAVIVLVPILKRLIPDIDLPDINIPWPSISLPVPTMPDIYLPVPTWEWSFDLNLPSWLISALDFFDEYKKVIAPLVGGIFIGLFSLRDRKKSERAKDEWARKSTASATKADPGNTELSSPDKADEA